MKKIKKEKLLIKYYNKIIYNIKLQKFKIN